MVYADGKQKELEAVQEHLIRVVEKEMRDELRAFCTELLRGIG